MTLFAHAARDTPSVPGAGGDDPFGAALEKYFAGEADPRTHELLGLKAS